jgi:hypothetical protein
LDGIIDELKVYDRVLSGQRFRRIVTANKPKTDPPLTKRILPAGPPGPGRFGAYYTLLKYYEEWDVLWRVKDHADVLVRFDEAPYRFVFWRGTNYIPCWVTGNGKWYSNEFNETWHDDHHGCAEPLSDKQCRYSHVRIIENNDARVVIHWRYALSDVFNKIAYFDENGGWGDWSDEYYTIYPDGVGVRKVTLWSSHPTAPHEFQESIVFNAPGTKPEDNIETKAVTIANMKGETRTYSWADERDHNKLEKLENANIQVVNLKSRTKPFLIVPPTHAQYGVFDSEFLGELEPYGYRKELSIFPWWNHAPVAQIPSDGRWAVAPDRASHTSLSGFHVWEDYELTCNSQTRIMLHGMTEKPAAGLIPLARSWLSAPKLKVLVSGVENQGYDPTQRAYVLSRSGRDGPGAVEFEMQASPESPVVNPAFVIQRWGDKGATLKVNGKPVARGKEFRFGHVHQLDSSDLIAWFKLESAQAIKISLSPVSR